MFTGITVWILVLTLVLGVLIGLLIGHNKYERLARRVRLEG